MKKIIAIVLTLCMVCALCACGVDIKTTSTNTVTENGVTTTTTTTNDNGKVETTTTTTTESEKEAGKALTVAETAEDGEAHKMPIGFYNESEKSAIVELCACPAGAGTHDNVLDEGDSIQPNGDGIKTTFTYDKDHLVWDFSILVEGTDEYVTFEGVDISEADAEEGISLYFSENEDGSWHLSGK